MNTFVYFLFFFYLDALIMYLPSTVSVLKRDFEGLCEVVLVCVVQLLHRGACTSVR